MCIEKNQEVLKVEQEASLFQNGLTANAEQESSNRVAMIERRKQALNEVSKVKNNYSTVTHSHGDIVAAKLELKGINQSIQNVIGEYYPEQQMDNPAPEYVKCHENRTRVLANQYGAEGLPAEIVKISVAGTSYTEWRRQNKGIKGKGGEIEKPINLEDGGSIEKVKDGYKFVDKDGNVKEIRKASMNVFSRAFSFIKCKIKGDMSSHEEKLKRVSEYERAKRQYKKLVEETYEKLYGKTVRNVGGKTYKHIRSRQKVDEDGIKVEKTSMAGPLAFGTNFGDYSMENSVKHIQQMYEPRIKSWIEKYGTNDPDELTQQVPPLHFLMQGHSRGGVATGVAVGKLMHYVNEVAASYANKDKLIKAIKFETVLVDPVYGITSGWNVYSKVDLKNQTEDMVKKGLDSLSTSCQSTVLYSIHSDHPMAFAPQMVKGCDRVILTPFAHSEGLGDVTLAENEQGQIEEKSQLFTDNNTNEAYKLSSLNEIDKGLYILDENRRLVKMQDEATALKVVEDVLKQIKASVQWERHNTIKEIIKDYFKR